MSAVEELMREVAGAQKQELRRMNLAPEVQQLVAARMVEGMAQSRAESRTWRWAALGTAAAATAAVLLVVVSLQRSPFLTFTIDDPAHFGQTGDLLAPPAGQAMAAVFSDGSRVVVGDRSNARIDTVDADGATVILDNGHLDASIIHRPHTRWEVRAGDYRIRVTGTRFSAAWNRQEKALTVKLYEGSVEVTGPGVVGSPAKVRAGHVLHASARGATLAMAEPVLAQPAAAQQAPVIEPLPLEQTQTQTQTQAPTLAAADPTLKGTATTGAVTAPATAGSETDPVAPTGAIAAVSPSPSPSPSSSSPSPSPLSPSSWSRLHRAGTRGAPALPAAAPVAMPAPALTPGWRSLARHAHYHEALTVALADGFDAQCERLRADDLVLLADVARLGGDYKRADQAYRAALRRFPDLDRPAFALGVMSFEARHDYRDAAAWLTRYLRAHPNGPLATEAAGRLLEAWDLAGEVSLAREAARSYLSEHPTGPHRALARRLAGP